MESDEMLDGYGNKLMDQKELAEFLMVSEKTLEHYRWRGIGPKYIKIGKLVRYIKCDVIEWLRARVRTKMEININELDLVNL